jgi:glucose/arabinose dehydrogenase
MDAGMLHASVDGIAARQDRTVRRLRTAFGPSRLPHDPRRGMKGVGSVLTIGALLVGGGCFKVSPSKGGGQVSDDAAERSRTPDRVDVEVPAGYRVEALARGLTFPTGIAFGDDGAIYVSESGYAYGEVGAQARIIELDPSSGGVRRVVAHGKHAPWNGLTFHDGGLYVAQGGAFEGEGRIVKFGLDGRETVVVARLPSGDHHTNGPIVSDGWIYFGQGTVTNSGVVGKDNHDFGWLERQPKLHDIPCKEVTLVGTNFTGPDPSTPAEDDQATTGAYLPFGTPSTARQRIEGALPCSGAILRVRPDGQDLQLVAWGLRNPFGLARSPDGTLYVSENGYDVRGSRPVFGTPDVLWKVEEGAWFGWPDFAAGEPLTEARFSEGGGDPKGFILATHPGKPPRPSALLDVHASANGFDIAPAGPFGHAGEAFIALFGDMAPSVGKVMSPVGFKVVRVDLESGIYRDFARNKGKGAGPASKLGTHGLERPVAARFDPRGEALYVVDFGVLQMDDRPEPRPGTGAVWRISREGGDADAR